MPTTKDFVYDLDKIYEAITENTKLIFICNPNNPTGTVVDPEKLTLFFERLPDHVLVILDEAYVEYAEKEKNSTGIEFVKMGFPVISIRTFSKFYGLAGIRIGYAVADEKYIEHLQAVKQTFAVNRIAIAGAEAALEDAEYGERMLQETLNEKNRLVEQLTSFGFQVVESHANFLFVDVKQDVSTLFTKLMEKGILIRPCTPWKLNTHARITIGTERQNNLLLDAIKEIQKTTLSI